MPKTLESVLVEQANPHATEELKKFEAITRSHPYPRIEHGPNVSADGRVYVGYWDDRPDDDYVLAVAKAFEVPVTSITFTVERKYAGESEWDSHTMSFQYFPLSRGDTTP